MDDDDGGQLGGESQVPRVRRRPQVRPPTLPQAIYVAERRPAGYNIVGAALLTECRESADGQTVTWSIGAKIVGAPGKMNSPSPTSEPHFPKSK